MVIGMLPYGGFAGSIGYGKVYAMTVPDFIPLNALEIFNDPQNTVEKCMQFLATQD
ncbi:hypothetical protein AB4Z13_28345 [Rhizobium sp. YAF28]|uniref:hypothetical protein n=1 Tax=Rhizobium sp. YAF28 TaxID=3233081 RepID=UPI003F98D401